MLPTTSVLIALVAAISVQGFQQISSGSNRLHSSRLLAIPAPLSNPPTTFLKCVQQAVVGAKKALAIGENLLEIEFPPLPLEYLEDSSSSARDVSDANTRWAIEFAKSFTDTLGQVTILYPDDAELQDAIKYVDMEGGDAPFPNIKMATARADSIKNAKSIDQVILSIFGATSKFILFPLHLSSLIFSSLPFSYFIYLSLLFPSLGSTRFVSPTFMSHHLQYLRPLSSSLHSPFPSPLLPSPSLAYSFTSSSSFSCLFLSSQSLVLSSP